MIKRMKLDGWVIHEDRMLKPSGLEAPSKPFSWKKAADGIDDIVKSCVVLVAFALGIAAVGGIIWGAIRLAKFAWETPLLGG